jgi:hypothetical protein
MHELPLYPVDRTHLTVLTDDIGIMQHAAGSLPDPDHGYCVDDVARALQVDLLHAIVSGWPAIAPNARRCLGFLVEAFDDTSGRFRNFRRVDGSWLDERASDDSQGRALHALGDAIASAPEPGFVETARALFERALPATNDIHALRAMSSVALGCEAAIRGGSSGAADRTFGLMADRLWSAFEPGVASEWPWPESRVTYENGLPIRAIIVAGRHHADPRMIQAGIGALEWLITAQTAADGHLSPIGNGWWSSDGPMSRFDQQPIEATTLMLAAETALGATGDARWRVVMDQAYAWFLGHNDLGIPVADPDRGGCYDGLMPDGVNLNQGAESTLMWLTALEHIRASRVEPPRPPTGSRPRALASVA